MLHTNPSLKMPIITRNQRNNLANVTQPSMLQLANNDRTIMTLFIDKIKTLLANCEREVFKENRMIVALEIYKSINKDLDKIILAEGIKKWIKFVCIIADKIDEFDSDYRIGKWDDIDKKLVETFMDEINRAKIYTLNIIKNYTEDEWSNIVLKTKEKFAAFESQRPRRNIKRVDYTGMDSIEPECEFTDIWFDTTIEEDPDYEFEEDEDDEDDEDDEVEHQIRFARVHPELSTEEKNELKEHLSQLVDNHRVRRNVAHVNYAGMDMNEEDVGQIHVNKRWFEDGKVKYIWKSYSLSQANEIEDEDYVDDV